MRYAGPLRPRGSAAVSTRSPPREEGVSSSPSEKVTVSGYRATSPSTSELYLESMSASPRTAPSDPARDFDLRFCRLAAISPSRAAWLTMVAVEVHLLSPASLCTTLDDSPHSDGAIEAETN